MTEWYILNVMSGQEVKVASKITDYKFIEEVLVPTKTEFRIKRGKKVKHELKLYPKYVFIKADLNEDLKQLMSSPIIRSMKVSFLGGMNNPKKATAAEIENIKRKISNNELQESIDDLFFDIGTEVMINDGPFKSFSGFVESFNKEKGKVRISISIFGRKTSVNLDSFQVSKK
jgi:transcriptional antiterminator NusG